MSFILDALRRGQGKSGSAPGESPEVTANTDAVLATLGYSRARLAPTLARRVRVYGLWVVILGLAGWTGWWYVTGNVGGPSFRVRQVADARTSPEPEADEPPSVRPSEQAAADAEVETTPEEVSTPLARIADAATPAPTSPAAPSRPSDELSDDSTAVTEPPDLPVPVPDTTPAPAAPVPEPVGGVEGLPAPDPGPDHFELALSYQREVISRVRSCTIRSCSGATSSTPMLATTSACCTANGS